jgi:hypothetical protein
MHPAAAVFDGLANPGDTEARPGWLMPYFGRAPQVFDDPTDYADPSARLVNSRTVSWLHPLADILGALRDAGLQLDWLHEHPACLATLPRPGARRRWSLDLAWPSVVAAGRQLAGSAGLMAA